MSKATATRAERTTAKSWGFFLTLRNALRLIGKGRWRIGSAMVERPDDAKLGHIGLIINTKTGGNSGVSSVNRRR